MLSPNPEILVALAVFGLIALASRQIGGAFARIHLPLITGFLLTGVVAGPYVLGLLQPNALGSLRFLEEITLGFIGFAAGAEMHFNEFKGRLRSIGWVTAGLVVFTFGLSVFTILIVADQLPFMQQMPMPARVAVALLGASILVARSPSSAIAVIKEMRARGPFTRMSLGVTVTMDVLVILLFAVSSSIGDILLTQLGFRLSAVLIVLSEILLAGVIGLLFAQVLSLSARLTANGWLKSGSLLTGTYVIFSFASWLRESTYQAWGLEVFLEPLLICMVAGVGVSNFTSHRNDFEKVIDRSGPVVYVVFFTLTGAGLAFATLQHAWRTVLILFVVRLVGVLLGSLAGGMLAGDPARINRVSWMAFVTQAGVGLGLAREVAVEFPPWGSDFATLLVAVIIVNQLIGPNLFKWALKRVGESRLPPEAMGRKTPVAFVFGLEGQALALARQLQTEDWKVKVVTRDEARVETIPEPGVEIVAISASDPESLESIGINEAQTVICMMEDEANLQVCQATFERFGTPNVIARSMDPTLRGEYAELDVTVVDPETAMVGLLDHFVRSPSAAAMLLGSDPSQDVVDFVVENPELDGTAVRDLSLPLDTLVLSVSRKGVSLISHGDTRLEIGDRLTILGSIDSLEEVAARVSD